MIPYLLSLMCLTGLHPKNLCPTRTPISNYQLDKIWNPSNPYEVGTQYQSGYYITSQPPPDRTTIRGRKIRIAAIEEPPYVNRILEINGSLTLEGDAKMVIGALRQALGFDWEIVTPSDGTLGIYNETTKQWTGMLGMLKAGTADFSIQFTSMLPVRLKEFNFSRPFGEERWVIMMQRPQETTDGEGLVAPFQREVWIYLMVSFVLMCPFVYIMVRLRCYACRKIPLLNDSYSIGHCIWFVYGAIMKQGSVLKPVADSSRILFATWWIFVTILSAFYTANLTAYLTLSKIPIPFNTLEKVGYRDAWIMKDGDTLQQVLMAKETKDEGDLKYYKDDVPYKEFYKLRWRFGKSNAYGKFMINMHDMVEEVRRKKFLLFEEQSRVERVVYTDFRSQSRKKTLLHKRCVFIMSKTPILRIPYGFAFRNQSIMRVFEPVLEELTKGGLFNFWRRLKLPLKDPCSSDSDFRERQLRNGDLWTTYQLCGSGYSMGFISFLVEIIHRWLTNRKLKGQLIPVQSQHNTTNLSFYKGNLSVPAGAPTFFDTEKFLKNINGRDYIVMKTADGRTRLVPKTDGLQALQPVYNPPAPMPFSFMS